MSVERSHTYATSFKNWEIVPHIANDGHYGLDIIMKSLEKIDKLQGVVFPNMIKSCLNVRLSTHKR
jgi:hypothetical protein